MATENWILLRGLMRESGHWADFRERFQAAFPQSQIHAVDLPGAGENLNQLSPLTMAEISEAVREQSLRLKGSGPVRVLAQSLGAMVALDWVARHPQELSSLVLINSSLRSLSPLHKRLRWQVWPDILKWRAITDPREREKRILEIVCNSQEAQTRLLPVWTDLARRRPIRQVNFWRQIAAAAAFKPPTVRPQVPGLILVGLGDRWTDPSCSEALHEQIQWPIERHPWAGHDLPADDGAWVIETVRQWVKNLQ